MERRMEEALSSNAIERLRRARERHEQLQHQRQQTERTTSRRSSISSGSLRSIPQRRHEEAPVAPLPRDDGSVHTLTAELRRLWHDQQEADASGKLLTSSRLDVKLEKIGSHEKDAVILSLFRHADELERQRSEVAALGEKIAAQLVEEHHDLRSRYEEETHRLQQELQDARDHHPEVARLEERVAELEDANREAERKLQFAVQKLHRSRKRERELQRMQDPLWDI